MSPSLSLSVTLTLGIRVLDEENTTQPPMEVLMEAMEFRERLSEATDSGALGAIQQEAQGLANDVIGLMDQSWKAKDFDRLAELTLR
mmetsp:Transcript_40654/g.127205  ORF Transcript_40654/g.127205 Transcript_40654/m.127205 type:complete len:87 (+) Transcript_40654:614-874(+)